MRRVFLTIIALAALTAPGLLAASPAQASAWKCNTTGQYSVCLRTDRLDSSHISGANIQATKFGSGCVNARFHHGIQVGSSWLQIWSDNGAFSICQNQTRSFYWTHSGSGAYVPPDGSVIGYLQVSTSRYYSGRITRAEI